MVSKTNYFTLSSYAIKATLLVCMFCYGTALAASTWLDYGKYDISWYDASSKELVIASEADMAGLAYLVNNGYTSFEGVIIKLTSDVNLDGNTWIGIGTKSTPFCGTFEGQGHSIHGINISEESGEYPYYGLWRYMNGAAIRNLNIEGSVRLDFTDASKMNTYAGSMVAYANSCVFENCKVSFTIDYHRSQTNNFTYEVAIGGFASELHNSSLVRCVFDGEINIDFGRDGIDSEFYDSHSATSLGGLAAEANATSFTYCGTHSDAIKIDMAGSKNANSMPINIGGIVGRVDENSELTSCFNNVWSFETIFRGSGIASIAIGGIASSANYYSWSNGGIFNCYSATNSYHITVQRYSSNIAIGGIAANVTNDESRFTANYSPSDLYVTTLIDVNVNYGYSGNISYTKDLMYTHDFLSELNLYPNINGAGNVWTSNGGLPYIRNESEISAIDNARLNDTNNFHIVNGSIELDKPRQIDVYTLTGKLLYSGRSSSTGPLPHGVFVVEIDGFHTKIRIK